MPLSARFVLPLIFLLLPPTGHSSTPRCDTRTVTPPVILSVIYLHLSLRCPAGECWLPPSLCVHKRRANHLVVADPRQILWGSAARETILLHQRLTCYTWLPPRARLRQLIVFSLLDFC
ncbi:hypothetical protein E2C01_057110 [Portunus trituberculatus]|uniref:Secreted protein n=1 Tax=Portunus trituberculatus TaxID=210409 RepID=A0A5B7H1G2_PORTR|nr:hypothetical protein [Portunus trituberculatus]